MDVTVMDSKGFYHKGEKVDYVTISYTVNGNKASVTSDPYKEQGL